MRHLRRLIQGLVAAAVVVGATLAVTTGESSAADLYVAPSGSDTTTCTQQAPCKSFNRAYTLANPGSVVEVAGGDYPNQTIDAPPKASGPVVVFRPASGAAVRVAWINVATSHLEFRDMQATGGTYNRAGAADVTYRNVDMEDFFIRSASKISYIGGSVGPNDGQDYMNWITAGEGSNTGSKDILLDGVTIHDFRKHQAGAHVDCIGIDDVDGLVIRNSRIRNCEHFGMIFGRDIVTNRAARNVTIENNFIDCCGTGYYSLGFAYLEGPALVRNNSLDLGIGFLVAPVSGLEINSNIIPSNNAANCSESGVTWKYNLIGTGKTCGVGDKTGPLGYVDPGSVDFHLKSTSAAINAGDPNSTLATDIDGSPRGANRIDAGADEFGSGPATGGAGPSSDTAGSPATSPAADSHSAPAAQTVVPAGSWKGTATLAGARPRLVIRRVRLQTVLRHGQPASVTCSASCWVTARLMVSAGTARRNGIPRTLAYVRTYRNRAGKIPLRLKPSAATARALAGRRVLATELRVAVTSRGRRMSTHPRILLRR